MIQFYLDVVACMGSLQPGARCRGAELGYVGCSARHWYTFCVCRQCHEGRWVQVKAFLPELCKSCYRKTWGRFTTEPRRLPRSG